MRLYTAKVRIAGSLEHEVIKHNLTAAEIHLLTHIHAGKHPVVVDIVHTGDVKNRSDVKERARLAEIYSKGELVEDRGAKLLTSLFGLPGVPLPQEYIEPPKDEPVEYIDDLNAEPEVIETLPPRVIKRSEPKKAADTLAG